MNIPCPSCGTACFAQGASSAVRRVRCTNCGKMIALSAKEGVAVVENAAAVVMTFTRTDAATGTIRTLVLHEDGTTELREGEPGVVSVTGHAALATVSAWRTLSAPALASFARAIAPKDDAPAPDDKPQTASKYSLEIGALGARHEWIGVPTGVGAERVWSMLRGLWGTVVATPP